MIVEMYKCMLTGMRSDFMDIAEFLRKTQVLQTGEFHDAKLLELTNEMAFSTFHEMHTLRTKLEEQQNKITSIQVNLPPVKSKEIEIAELPTDREELFEFCKEKIDDIEPKFRKLQQRSDYLNQKLSLVERYRSYIQKIRPLILELAEHHHFGADVMFVDRYEHEIEDIVEDLEDLTNRKADIFTRRLDDRITAIIFLAPNLDEIEEYFDKEQITTIAKPEEFESTTVKKICVDIQDLVDEVEDEIMDVRQEIEELAKENASLLKALNAAIDEKIVELGLADNVQLTEYTFSITGYIPKTKLEGFEERLDNEFKGGVTLTSEKADVHDKHAPILRKTSRFVSPFTLFTDLLSKPSYGSLDPATIVAFLWPFYWGFMVGDVGYGLMAILIGIILRKKMSDSEAFTKMGTAFMFAGVFTVIFGIIYGEVFGDLLVRFHILKHEEIIFDRYIFVAEYLVISLLVAFVCIFFGVVLGGINGIKLRHGTEIKMSITTMIYLLTIVSMIVNLLFFNFNLIIFGVALLILIGSVVYLAILEGVVGIIHAIEVLTNILSFARLMAIGLVGVILANIANIFIFGIIVDHHVESVISPIIGVPAGIALHILNFALIILSPSIQALRLNLVEMMNQYYEGDGEEYHPFGEDTQKSINL